MHVPYGGVQYSIRGGGERPAITAAAIASLFNAGEYDSSEYVKKLLGYCEKNVWPGTSQTAISDTGTTRTITTPK